MIKRDTIRLYKSLMVSLFLFIIPISVIAQDNSIEYTTIKNSKTLSLSKKMQQIDSLLISKRQDSLTFIIAQDYLDFGKDFYKKNLKKTIEITQDYVDFCIGKNISLETIHKRTINNLGLFYEWNNASSNSIKTYKLLIRNNSIDEFAMDAYISIANNYHFLGDLYTASHYYERSISSRKNIDTENSHLAYINNSIDASINYKKIATLESVNRGINILNDAISFAKKKRINSKLVSLYLNLGNLYNDREDFDFENSVINYNKALRIALKTNDSKYLPRIYNDLGYSYLQNKDSSAIYYFNKVLGYNLDPSFKSIVYKNKSTYYLDKNINLALENNHYAIQALITDSIIDTSKTILSKEVLALNPYKYDLLNNIIHKGKVLLTAYSKDNNNVNAVKDALKTYHLADYLVDNIRFESIETSSKLFWRGVASEIYTNATKACYILNNHNDAFYFIEKNKALLLLEDITSKQLEKKAKISSELIEKQKKLRLQITNLQEQIRAVKNDTKKDSLTQLLLNIKNDYLIFLDTLKIKYPLLSKTNNTIKLLNLKEAKQTLNNNTAYISYILNDKNGYGLLITETETSFFELAQVDSLLKHSKVYRHFLERPYKNESDLYTFNVTALKLYNSLFPESISEIIKQKKIIIIPDYYLQNIPFEAFITSKYEQKYLIENNDLSYAYSITFLKKNKSIKRDNTNEFLGFAPIEFNNKLVELPQSEIEIKAISKLFKSEIYTHNQATTINFKEHSKDYDIIHFATHANANDSISPWIAFSDKKMTLNELYLTNNTADLVVLSACKTSLGEINQGEGIMSLARGFFNTGANSVISTLWNVNDKSSSELLTNFYNEIKKGKTKSEALRLSKLNYINSQQLSGKSPHYWASFVLIGDDEIIPSFHSNNLLILISIILVISLLLFFTKIKFKK